jgi:hypothetical protein
MQMTVKQIKAQVKKQEEKPKEPVMPPTKLEPAVKVSPPKTV